MPIPFLSATSDSPLPPPAKSHSERSEQSRGYPTTCHSERSEESHLLKLETRNLKLPPSPSPDNGTPVSPAHYSQKDKIWVSQALAASSGALAASKRRLKQHLRSLPPDSPEALAILSFLQFGP